MNEYEHSTKEKEKKNGKEKGKEKDEQVLIPNYNN